MLSSWHAYIVDENKQILLSVCNAQDWHLIFCSCYSSAPGVLCSAIVCNNGVECPIRQQQMKAVGQKVCIGCSTSFGHRDGHAIVPLGFLLK
jgi:hypothetical protein